MRSDSFARFELERAEGWRECVAAMPALSFPSDWGVAIIPPFAGAMARFLVSQGKARVSVYADFYDALGCFGSPYWEIHPSADGDTDRFPIDSAADLIAAISASLTAQQAKP